jgi:hypothetical protein
MRILVIGLGIVVAALAANIRPGNAQYNGAWCIEGGLHGPGSMDCSYNTLRQCQASRSGNGGACVRNPDRGRRETTGRGRREQGGGY